MAEVRAAVSRTNASGQGGQSAAGGPSKVGRARRALPTLKEVSPLDGGAFPGMIAFFPPECLSLNASRFPS